MLDAMASMRRTTRVQKTARLRMLQNAEIAAGSAADGRDRWRVDEVLQWRGRTRSMGRGQMNPWAMFARGRWALLRWSGFNLETGLAWDDSWVCQSWLTADLRVLGRVRRKRFRSGSGGSSADGMEDGVRSDSVSDQRQVRRRRTPRINGEDAGPGLV